MLLDPPSRLLVLHLIGLALGKSFRLPIIAFPSHSPHHCPFTPVEPSYGDDVYKVDYLPLFIIADLRMDSTPRPRPVSSVTFADLRNTHISTTRLNDGIYTVYQFSVATSTRLHKLEYVIQFYVYGEIFDNPLGLLSACRTGCVCCVVLLSLFYGNVHSRACIPCRSTVQHKGWRISFVNSFIIRYLFVHVFVVYISHRNE
jgi:hypothetical protein